MEISPSPTILMEVYIDRIFCNGCGKCVDLCSMGVFKIVNKKAEAARAQVCIGCFKCRDFCPTHAIAPRWVMRVS
jgi:NAD-dependent dihydropyrimidine dehydrogenase PreA subunit